MEFYKYMGVLVLYTIIPPITSKFQCRTSPNATGTHGCTCISVKSTYEVICPLYVPNITVEVNLASETATIQCISKINWDQYSLPLIEMENLQSLEFLNCNSLPINNFTNILDRLRINGTKELIFTYSGDFENSTLTSDYFTNIQNLENLNLSKNKLRSIDKDAFDQLDKLIKLDLKINRLGQLPNGLFKNLPKLTYLDLAQNELTYLPVGLFENLTELRKLCINRNNLTIKNSTFKNLRNLELLELSLNQLQDLPGDIFYELENLKQLSLKTNNLRRIPENIFMKNTGLTYIDLRRNPILSLPDVFSILTKLKIVLLNECKLSSLSSNLFHGLVDLEKLHLQKNQIQDFPENIFVDLVELQDLDMSSNKIRELPNKIFSSLKQLKTLNLQNNVLTSINRTLFYYLENVEVINLKNNGIRSIHIESFHRVVSLKTIILANNSFDLPETFQTLFYENKKLVVADLSHNCITTITDEFISTLTSLTKLDLSYNKIDYLDFSRLSTVSRNIKLYLTFNNISTVNFDDAEDTATANQNNEDEKTNREVYLNGNPIKCNYELYNFIRYFDGSINPSVRKFVTIQANNLSCSPWSPSDLIGVPIKNLDSKIFIRPVLHQSHNSCKYGVRLWDQALIVDCRDKNLTEVPKLILPTQRFINGIEVYLERNLLTSGPRENMGYENVTKLVLSSNNISEITWVPPKVKVLELDNNKINYFNDSTVLMLNISSLTNITLGNNPWKCDCSTVNLNTFLVSRLTSKQLNVDTNYIKCRNGGKFLDHSPTDLCPSIKSMVLGFGITICLILLVIAVSVALYLGYQQEIKVWLYAHNMCLWFVTEEDIDKDKLYDAFLCYSHKDEEFVLNKLRPVLEQGPQPYKLCIHIRDWPGGGIITEQIASSVANSRRTLVVLSRHFLKSGWGIMEFRTAHTQAMNERRNRVILILYGDINIESDLDDEIKAYVRTNTYLKWGDPWFWDKLRYALPHSRINESRSQKNQNIAVALSEEKADVTNNDKLELINGGSITMNPGSTPPISTNPGLVKNNPLNFTPNQTVEYSQNTV